MLSIAVRSVPVCKEKDAGTFVDTFWQVATNVNFVPTPFGHHEMLRRCVDFSIA
jgi:hypothetical protein